MRELRAASVADDLGPDDDELDRDLEDDEIDGDLDDDDLLDLEEEDEDDDDVVWDLD